MPVQAHATAKYIRTSAQKAGLVMDLIRGRDVNAALATLRFARKSVAQRHREGAALGDRQRAAEGRLRRRRRAAVRRRVLRNQGPSQKRIRPAPMGRAFRVVKRTAHLTVRVAERPSQAWRAGGRAGGATAARPRAPKRRARRRSRRRRRRGAREEGRGEDERRRRAERDGSNDEAKLTTVMGQKVHPHGFRLGFNKTWRSRWFADKDYAKLLHEDLKLRDTLKTRFAHAGVSKIEIERAANKLKIDIYTSRPGIIIGRKGTEVDKLKTEIQKKTNREVFINIQEIQKPELDAQLIGESVAMQLEKRVAFRRAMRKAVESALRFGARGIKVRVSGRLNGAEIARSEWYLHGQLPLQTLRADIDYGFAEAFTTYGAIGVKVWLYKGERLAPRIGREEDYRAPRRAAGGRG